MMRVRDMIDLLERYPEDMRVVVNGYEQGYDDLSPERISIVPITLNTGVYEWEGRHGDEGDVPGNADMLAGQRGDAGGLPKEPRTPATTINALVLRRQSR